MTIPRYLLTLSNAFVIRGVYSTAVRLSRPKTRDRKLPRMALFFSSFGITLAHMVHYFGHAVSRPVNFIVHCREPSVVSCAMRFERIPIFFPIYVAASCHSLREISLGRSCPIYRSDIFSWVGSGWRPVYVMRLSGPLIKTPVTSTTPICAHNQSYTKTLIGNTETEQVVK